jgi:thiol-disulfide isomerase/thioredoxin
VGALLVDSQKKVSAKEVEELVRGERKVPLIVDFYATWCGPCVLMAQDIEMVCPC